MRPTQRHPEVRRMIGVDMNGRWAAIQEAQRVAERLRYWTEPETREL